MRSTRHLHFNLRHWPCLLLLLLPLDARSAAPSVSFLYPAGAPRDSTNTLTLGGTDKTWPLHAWTDHAGLAFSPLEKAGQLSVTIHPQAALGPHLVFFQNSNGVSAPKIFVVGSLPETEESEPNDALRQAHSLPPLPITVHGRLNKGDDVDSFTVHLLQGQWLLASVDAYSLDSPMDALLHLRDQTGSVLAFNHDHANLDPFLAFQAPAEGSYVLQLAAFAYPPQANVRYTGGDNCIYRLTLTSGPYVHHTMPMAVQRGTNTTLQVHGWNLGPDRAPSVTLNLECPASAPECLPVAWLPSDNAWRLPVTPHPQRLETEPNNDFNHATFLTPPFGIHGAIDPAGDQDDYRFEARKGDLLTFTLQSASLGFPLDAVLQILDDSGKSLVRSDDSDKQPDPRLTWTAPSDGVFAVRVTDLYQQGGHGHVYQLEALPAHPDFNLILKDNSLIVEAGKTVELKATVERLHGHTNQIRIVAESLPEGVVLESGDVPAKTGDVNLKLTASPSAGQAQQRLVLRAESEEAGGHGANGARRRLAKFPLKGQFAEAGDLLLNETAHLWLTILPITTNSPDP